MLLDKLISSCKRDMMLEGQGVDRIHKSKHRRFLRLLFAPLLLTSSSNELEVSGVLDERFDLFLTNVAFDAC